MKKIKNFFENIGGWLVDHDEEVMMSGYVALIGTYIIYMIALAVGISTGKFQAKS